MEKIILRPHHLLCTQTFRGKGYSEDFIENMTRISNLLRTERNKKISLIISCDSLCAFCPNKVCDGNSASCTDNEKVFKYDKNVVKHFNLKEGNYYYQELVRQINSMMTPKLLNEICGDCKWSDICKEAFPFP